MYIPYRIIDYRALALRNQVEQTLSSLQKAGILQNSYEPGLKRSNKAQKKLKGALDRQKTENGAKVLSSRFQETLQTTARADS